MLRARIVACLVFLLVASCGDPGTAALTVTVRTDWVPGVDFGSVLVELDAPGVEPTTRPAFVFEDYAEGVRIAELAGLPSGTHHLVVALLSPAAGLRLDDASVRVDLRENDELEVTVLITREVRACESTSDCTSSVACVEGSCVDGNCLFAPRNERCAATEYCDPESGCLARGADGGVDADAGVSDGGSGPDASGCDGPTSVWRRTAEWTHGAVIGSTDGNPSPDSMGRPTWFYEHTSGGPLGSTDAWYAQAPTLLVWDDSWFGSDGGWASFDDVAPMVSQQDLTHVATPSYFVRVPRVRLQNPTGRSVLLTISGRLDLFWAGSDGAGLMDADVVIARLDATGRAVEHLLGATFPKPTADTSYEDIGIDVSASTIVAPDESIAVSVRAEYEVDQTWLILRDDVTYLGVECD